MNVMALVIALTGDNLFRGALEPITPVRGTREPITPARGGTREPITPVRGH